jgi:Kef-type K+ transport system membrane component KefB
MRPDISSLVLVAAIAAAAPLLGHLVGRWLAVPIVVFEIVLGVLLGPQVAGWIIADPYFGFLSTLGLATLFLLAGYELDFGRIRGRPLRRSALGWIGSVALGVLAGLLLAPSAAAGVMVGICLTSTALGTIMPVLRDAGELESPFGTAVLAIGAAGEFGPLIAVALFLSGRSPATESALLVAFAALTGVGLALAGRFEPVRLHRVIEATLNTSGQFAVRLVLLVLAVFTGLASAFGLDLLLGAFAAGVLIQVLLRTGDPVAVEVVEAKLDAVGFGFLVPVFFIHTGVTFDVDALFGSPATLALVPTALVLFVAVRGIPATVAAPAGSRLADRTAIALFGATGLPIIVAVTTIGLDHGELPTSTAAALVGAGMLSVLVFPLLALATHRRGGPTGSRGPHPDAALG